MNEPDLATVVTTGTEFEAQAKAAVLRDEGIEARVVRNAPSWTGHMSISPTARGASVLVQRDDLERAKALLRDRVSDSVDLHWDEVDIGEREDDLPLHRVGRTPLPARLAFLVALALATLTLLLWTLGLLF